MGPIGRYEVLEVLGSGASGVLHRAMDPILKREVVILLCPSGASGDFGERTLARFSKHPGIIDIHDAGVHEGRPFQVLELVEGRSLAQMIRAGVRITTDAALSMAEAMARALHYMHVRGVEHNDVRPANVVMRKAGEPVLVDFRHAADVGGSDAVGAGDIAGLGATLTSVLTGRLDVVGLDDLADVAPPYVVDVVRRCHAGEYRDADALARSLHAVVEAHGQSSRPTRRFEPREGETVLLHAEHTEADRQGSYREYHIDEHLSAGGFGDVYRAVDRVSGESVALKVLKHHLLADVDAVARFRREADVLACLQHPNIVRIFNYGRYGSSVFIAMELIAGDTLEQIRRKESPMPVERAAGFLMPILSALHVLSNAGIVHRDVKPNNVKVCDGRVVLLDFGIARVEGWETLTEDAAFIGTLRYASPEQMRGSRITPASDVYAAGVLLYELLTRHAPHEAEDAAALMMHIATEPPTPIETHRRDLPDDLVTLVNEMLARDPAARPDADAAAHALACA